LGVIKWLRRRIRLWRRTLKEIPEIWDEFYGEHKKRWHQYRSKETGQYVSIKRYYWCYVKGFTTRTRLDAVFEAWAEFQLKGKEKPLTKAEMSKVVDDVIEGTDYWGILNMAGISSYWRAEKEPIVEAEGWPFEEEIPEPGIIHIRIWRQVEDNFYDPENIIIDEEVKFKIDKKTKEMRIED